MKLPFVVGTTDDGEPHEEDLAELPHLLIAGTTGSGKSVFMHSLITDLMTSTNARFLLFDPKRVEMSLYRDSPALIRQPVVNVPEAAGALRWVEFAMEQRFRMLESRGLRDWADMRPILPRLVVVIDELANLILADKTVERPLVALASQGRAAGIHLVVATQRPSADVLTGLLRANVPARIAFATVTSIESRIILDETGAEDLKGKGDMLFRNGTRLVHLRGRFVSAAEITRVSRGAH
jgi:S-DNA-T family DNA segregation ATPase FtsK/SpoIIIE